MMYCEVDKAFQIERLSCATSANDIYRKVFKVDRPESLKKHTQVSQPPTKASLIFILPQYWKGDKKKTALSMMITHV
jgi:hypothetical protein